MRILSITAQKPHSTGSGVYLTELVKELHAQGHEQAVIAGLYKTDETHFPEGVKFYPVYFKTNELPFAIAGMSDEMPYESTVYGQMTQEMTDDFEAAFREKIKEAVEGFNPDLILCHHLYLVTSLARELYPAREIFGFCHNTDIRQLKKIGLRRDYIIEQVRKLDRIFSLHKEQKEEIVSLYGIPEEKIQIVGVGYNQHLFYTKNEQSDCTSEREDDVRKKLRLIFAGKLSEKKGVMSLLRSLSYLPWRREELELVLAGGYGRKDEYEQICQLAEEAPYPVKLLGRLPQEELAEEYRKSDIFVLPSFYEGLPMTVIEAMACGDKIVVTDLPGVRPWIDANVGEAPVVYVPMPKMRNTDEPVEESLPVFEKELAEAITVCSRQKPGNPPNLTKISWETICHMVVSGIK